MVDQYVPAPPEGWPLWMEQQIQASNFVLLICTAEYLRRVEGKIEGGRGFGVLWEANLIRNALYPAVTANRKFVPILLDDGDLSLIPLPLRGTTHFRLNAEGDYEALYRSLTNQPRVITPTLGPLRSLPAVAPKSFPVSFSERSQAAAPPSFGGGLERRQRLQMLQSVRNVWIDGVLHKSLYEVARIDLRLEEKAQLVERPWQIVTQAMDEAPPLAPGISITTVFEQHGRALLILGAPGSGKTTLLLELARDLLDKAEHDESLPIPTIFNLSSWAIRRPPIAKWLMDELNDKYFVPRKVGKIWIEGEQVLPLLDGLDEVALEYRDRCVNAINAFRREYGLVPITICSRLADYEALAVRLRMPAAILIRPLAPKEATAYIDSVGEPLGSLRSAVQHNPELMELFDTPLMLTLGMIAYSGNVGITEPNPDRETMRDVLLAKYVSRMIDGRGPDQSYSREQICQWLGWLATSMRLRAQTVFQVENIQPDWLCPKPSPWRLGSAMGLAVAAPFLLQGSILFYPFVVYGSAPPGLGQNSVLDFMRSHPLQYFAMRLCSNLLLWGGGGALIYWFLRKRNIYVRPVETLRISVASIRAALHDRRDKVRTWRRRGFRFGAGLGVLFGLGTGIFLSISEHDVPLSLVVGLLTGVLAGLLYGLFGLALGSLTSATYAVISGIRGELEVHVRPNEGTIRSLRTGIFVWFVFVMFFAFASLIAAVLLPPSVRAYASVLFVSLGVTAGTAGGLFFGGFFSIQHYVLRFFLWYRNCPPYRYVGFLNHAAGCSLLRRVGGGYIFIHRMVLDFFAEHYGGTVA
jgi:hypothetical protein